MENVLCFLSQYTGSEAVAGAGTRVGVEAGREGADSQVIVAAAVLLAVLVAVTVAV